MSCLDLTEAWGRHDLTLLSCAYTESASSLNVRFKETAYSLLVPSSGSVSNPVLELEKEPTALGSCWLRLRTGSMVCMFTPEQQHCFPNRTMIWIFFFLSTSLALGGEPLCLSHLVDQDLLFLRHPLR